MSNMSWLNAAFAATGVVAWLRAIIVRRHVQKLLDETASVQEETHINLRKVRALRASVETTNEDNEALLTDVRRTLDETRRVRDEIQRLRERSP